MTAYICFDIDHHKALFLMFICIRGYKNLIRREDHTDQSGTGEYPALAQAFIDEVTKRLSFRKGFQMH